MHFTTNVTLPLPLIFIHKLSFIPTFENEEKLACESSVFYFKTLIKLHLFTFYTGEAVKEFHANKARILEANKVTTSVGKQRIFLELDKIRKLFIIIE